MKNNIVRLVVTGLVAVIAPWIIYGLCYIPIPSDWFIAGLIFGGIIYFVVLGFAVPRGIRSNFRLVIYGIFFTVVAILIMVFVIKFYDLKFPKKAIWGYYVFVVLAIIISIAITYLNESGKGQRHRKKSRRNDNDDDI